MSIYKYTSLTYFMAAVAAIVVPAHASTPTALPHVKEDNAFRCVSK
jgi:hypothetical protein